MNSTEISDEAFSVFMTVRRAILQQDAAVYLKIWLDSRVRGKDKQKILLLTEYEKLVQLFIDRDNPKVATETTWQNVIEEYLHDAFPQIFKTGERK